MTGCDRVLVGECQTIPLLCVEDLSQEGWIRLYVVVHNRDLAVERPSASPYEVLRETCLWDLEVQFQPLATW